MIHKRSTTLSEGLNRFHGTNLTLSSDVGQEKYFSIFSCTPDMTEILPWDRKSYLTCSIPLNIHEVWPCPFWGEAYRRKKIPVDHFIGHIHVP